MGPLAVKKTGLSASSNASSSLNSMSLLSLDSKLSRFVLIALITSVSESESPWILLL